MIYPLMSLTFIKKIHYITNKNAIEYATWLEHCIIARHRNHLRIRSPSEGLKFEEKKVAKPTLEKTNQIPLLTSWKSEISVLILAVSRKTQEIKLQSADDEEDVGKRGVGGGTALTPHGTHKVAP